MTADARIAPQTLAAAELFAGLPAPALEAAAAAMRLQAVAKGAAIFHQGDCNARAHVVVWGGVRIAQTGDDGAQLVVRFVGPGEMFGALALFTDGGYPADAIALEETLEASWSEAELVALMMRYPQIAINAIRVVGKRMQDIQNRTRELATQPAERRIAHALLRLARQSGRATPDGETIAFSLRRKDIADFAGTTLYTASRILTGWQKAGLLVSDNRRLTICNPSRLVRIAENAPD